MTAVSQSYPNYLGGLNEQPDEQKKPGQLVEALNVIPDPVVGLSRRPGFELIADIPGIDPNGTWFEMKLSNDINSDYIYFGCVNPDGRVIIFSQDGVEQEVRYTDSEIKPHKKYQFNNSELSVFDDDNELIDKYPVNEATTVEYLQHNVNEPLKYCVSKGHVIFANPGEVVEMEGKQVPSITDQDTYYSFINLKVIDTENYNYTFRRFFADDDLQQYKYVKNIVLESVVDLGDRYDTDLQLALQTKGPYRFELGGPGVIEKCVVEVDFRGQIIQLDSSDGDGYRNEARYTWITKIIDSGKGYEVGQVFTETLQSSDVGPDLPDLTLTFKVKDVQQVTATKNEIIVPDDLSNNNSAEDILNDLAAKFKASGIDKAVVVGSGLYLQNTIEFSVSTPEIAVADVMNSQKMDDDLVPIVRINSVAELPIECYAGFIVRVSNSLDGKRDYYLQYTAESESTNDLDLTKSDGYWKEIAKPYEEVRVNPRFLPHMITAAKEPLKDQFTWIASPIDYEKRDAGTAKDNPSMFVDEARITEINYYKNRLFFMTNVGTVISSRAGEIDNLFLNTAVTTSPIDPIDLVANSNQRVPIHGSAVVNNGMVLFGDSEQYSMATANDVLTSETASITKIANYTFDPVSKPIYLGTNLGFISSGMTRFYEMTNVYDRGPVDINERSQQIQTQFGKGFNIPASSREQSMVIIYKRHTLPPTASFLEKEQYKSMYMYRFRQENSQESSQTAWVRWKVDEPITYVSMPRDAVFVILESGKVYKMDSQVVANTNLTNLGIPQFTDGWSYDVDGNLVKGTAFDTVIKFPTIYGRTKGTNPQSDVTANLTIHRLKLSTALVGAYNLKIERRGYETYEMLVEQTPSDAGGLEYKEWGANIEPLRGQHVETVPVYTRNFNLNVTIESNYDAPLSLRSMTWEGDWNRPYYKSV